MRRENRERRTVRRSPAIDAPTAGKDIIALEAAAESLVRFGDIRNAIALWAIALRLREETK